MNNDEVINDVKLKEIWNVELDILEKFKILCTKYKLTYYAGGGTMLGAVRHKGFIPWDDDIDLYMMWKDYKILLDIAPKELSYPYFFQSYKTEPYGEVSHSRIRRTDTTGCTKWEYENIRDLNYNRGIFIDIFPLFNIPEDMETRETQKEMILRYWRAIRGYTALSLSKYSSPNAAKYEQYIADYMSMQEIFSIEEIKENYIKSCALIKEETEEVGLTSFRTFKDNTIWKRKWFNDVVNTPFEDTSIAIPVMSEKILEKSYGDWRTPQRGALHEMYISDTRESYRNLINLLIDH